MLGGLAAGILTSEERQTLFEAALHDQALFNEVADELEFGVFLQSPETRAQLANRIEVEPARRRWWALRPAWLALSGVLAASIVLFVAISHRPGEMAHLSATPRVIENSAAKEPRQVASGAPATAMPGPPVIIARPAGRAKPLPAVAQEAAKDSVAPNRHEPRDQQLPEPAAPQPAPAPQPARAPVARQQAMAQAFVERTAAASLTGTVHDASGAAIRDAKVDIVNNSTNTAIHAATDANGRFVALSLPEGPYTVTANVPGFVAERRSITIEGNQPAEMDIPLRIGNMAETISVTSAASSITLAQKQTQVAVLDFASGNQQNPAGAQVADQISNQLVNSGQVRVIDRDRVQQAAQSQNATGRPPNAQEAAALGRSIGADAVILGSVQAPGGLLGSGGNFAKSKVAPSVSVMAEIIDTKQAKPLVKVSADAASLQGATNLLGDKLQSQLAKPAEGKVTHRTGDIVSIAFVEPPGLQVGAHCDVIRGTRKIGELVITSVNGRSAFGKFSGTSQPRAGDRVTSSR
jgi:hypothetical protein